MIVPKSVFLLLCFAFAVCLIYWVILQPRFVRRLMDEYPATYDRLGRPPDNWQEFYRPDEIPGVFALSGFIISGAYRELADPELTRLGNRIRLTLSIAALAFGGLPISCRKKRQRIAGSGFLD